jgi:hypothetical protein
VLAHQLARRNCEARNKQVGAAGDRIANREQKLTGNDSALIAGPCRLPAVELLIVPDEIAEDRADLGPVFREEGGALPSVVTEDGFFDNCSPV